MSALQSELVFDDDLPRVRSLRRGEASLWSSYAAHAYGAESGGELVVVDVFPSSLSDSADIVEQSKTLVGVRHPNLSTVRRVDGCAAGETRQDVDERCALDVIVVSDFVEGERLDALRESKMPTDICIRVVIDVLAALSALHDRGIVHGHVEAQNVILGLDGVTKLVRGYIGPGRLLVFEGGAMNRVAPEVLRKDAIDFRADVYGAGVLLKELVPEAPPAWAAQLAGVVVTATSKDPRDRYASVADMARALRMVAQSHVATPNRTADFVDEVAGDRIITRRGALAVPSERRIVSRPNLSAPAASVPAAPAVIMRERVVALSGSGTTAMLRAAVKRWSRTTIAIGAIGFALIAILAAVAIHERTRSVAPAPAQTVVVQSDPRIPAPPDTTNVTNAATPDVTIELPEDTAHPRPAATHHVQTPKKQGDRSAIF
jgi:hypothetical protein